MKANLFRILFFGMLAAGSVYPAYSQMGETIQVPAVGGKTLLNTDWYARRANEVKLDGNQLSAAPFQQDGWMKARVPGTVLTTMLENRMFPAPEFSMNNTLIPDIHDVGNEFYTFWFVRPFKITTVPQGKTVWLNFRGINYKADIFLNGKRINASTHEGMFLRESYNITPYIRKDSINLLAVIVFPPDPAGNPNGGQGGDGLIARNVTMQYTPGWDWIQPVRDRNTGIWDEVSVTVTGAVRVQHPYVVTKVPGIRQPAGNQKDAFLKTTVEVENTSSSEQKGTLVCETNGNRLDMPLMLAPKESRTVAFKEITLKNPRLWWPNGIGEQALQQMKIYFETNGAVSDSRELRYGIREITSLKCPENGGRKFYVNGQPVFITGGNYIASDWMLRLSPERYRAEVRFHAEMNMRMIRVWGGALLERPEFYDACDEYGILVFQDLWGSGDCNGAWNDATKAESRERRWEYPDNHALFFASVEDQVKMVRNHPSLCLWTGGNEWPQAKDIDEKLHNDIFPRLDPERLFVSYSTDTLFTRNTIGGVGDGPYGIQEPEWFFTFRSTPFNPESGSIGSPEIESMREIMTKEELSQFPHSGRARNAAWIYHKDLGYGDQLERYGKVKDIETYCKYAQIVNYDQYRSFMEGWASRMWDWYTGILIWKTQNPWTALRGQMYDWFLDVNGCLYGAKQGCEPLHAQYNLASKQVELVNTALGNHNLTVKAQLFSRVGEKLWEKEASSALAPNSVVRLFSIPAPEKTEGAYFLRLSLTEAGKEVSRHIYWLTTKEKDYTALTQLPVCKPEAKLSLQNTGGIYKGVVTLKTQDKISFFNRIKVFDKNTGKRILPVHYSDNYISLMPGDVQEVSLEFASSLPANQIEVVIDSWTSERFAIQ